jgi:uncharacterized membrane protein YfcA
MNKSFWTYVLIGFAAQIVDGAPGMAFGVISTTMLLTHGWAPAPAIAVVRFAKVATGAASGLAHLWMGNVLRPLCRRLVVPGALGNYGELRGNYGNYGELRNYGDTLPN